MPQVYIGADVFDGTVMHRRATVLVEDGLVRAVLPAGVSVSGEVVRLPGGILAPGFIDLQVNGGGGWQVDGTADAARIAALCAVQARLGATGILPTLITDTRQATAAVIAAGIAAARAGVPGFLGLHLEGPHLDPRRKGAHDSALIRPMDDADLHRLLDAAAALPALLLTVAPEAVTNAQIGRLAAAGVVVSLGHSDCDAATAARAAGAGARCATHLFNAMSQLGNREPGLVGAVLSCLITLPLALPFQATGHDLGLLAGLGLGQLAIPCVLAVMCAQVLKAPEVSLLALLEVPFGILLAWIGANEAPNSAVMAGGALVIGALVTNELIGWRARQ